MPLFVFCPDVSTDASIIMARGKFEDGHQDVKNSRPLFETGDTRGKMTGRQTCLVVKAANQPEITNEKPSNPAQSHSHPHRGHDFADLIGSRG